MMSGRDLFGVVVRTTGLFGSLYGIHLGIWGLLGAVNPDYKLGPDRVREGTDAGHYFFSALLFILAGKIMLQHAHFILRIA